jgi:hypothetical protein
MPAWLSRRLSVVGDAELSAGAIARVGQMETWAAEITPGLLERGAEMEERLGLALAFDEPSACTSARLMTCLGGSSALG